MHQYIIKYFRMNIILQTFCRHCLGIAGPFVRQVVPSEFGIKRNNPKSISLILLIDRFVTPRSVSRALTGGRKR